VRKADNLPTSCAVITKSGKLNFLETSGPVQALNETALPLPLYTYVGRGGTVVKVRCYKSEGCWFDSRWCHWNFSLT